MSFESYSEPGDFAFIVFVALLWFFPVGAIVMRRRFADATGFARVAKYALYVAAAMSLPLALLFTAPYLMASFRSFLHFLRGIWRL